MPKTNEAFWAKKFAANVARDNMAREALMSLGWRVAVIWECETKDTLKLEAILRSIAS
jgi:DNA mismatch endonuclease (patch repair protein)